jgi:hypothetical protein
MAPIGAIAFQGALLGAVATLAMDVVMRRRTEGMTPTYVAASVLTRVAPERVSDRRAKVVHYASGMASGALFLLLLEAAWAVFGIGGGGGWIGVALATAVSAGVLLAWLIGFFSLVVLPRYDQEMAAQRLETIRRDWRAAAVTHVAALVVLWFTLALVLV